MKNVRLSVKSEYFGVDWAKEDAEQDRYEGVVNKWKTEGEILMIKWEGWASAKATHLDDLKHDADGNSLELQLLPYEDGRAPPVFQEPRPVRRAPAPAARSASSSGGNGDSSGSEEDEEDDDGPPDEYENKGVTWQLRPPQYIKKDARTAARQPATLNKGDLRVDTIDRMFDYLLPDDLLEFIVNKSNPKLLGSNAIDRKLTVPELKQWWGYALAASLHTGITLEKLWSDTPIPESIMPPPMFGQHGMVWKRFKRIRGVMSFGASDPATLEQDPWAFVRPLVDKFNEARAAKFNPGWLITMDESMCAWRGQEGEGSISKCPKISFVPRKPEPLGVELKTTADALSGVLIRLEICEGKKRHGDQEWYDEYGHTTATSLRLVKPWFGTNRVVAGDSWFASVKLANALLGNGLHFIGDIKTNKAQFCGDALELATGVEQGDWAVYSTDLKLGGNQTMPIYAVSARRSTVIHNFVATCGTTLPGNNQRIYEEGDDGDTPEAASVDAVVHTCKRKCPRVLNDYTLAQPAIDRHNRYRQFILGMEKRIHTNQFSMRFGTTIFGMMFTDAFFAHKYWNDPNADFKAEMGKLAYRMMHNPDLPAKQPAAAPQVSRKRSGSPSSDCSADGESHVLCKLVDLPGFQGYHQQRCAWCPQRTVWCCATCSVAPFDLVPLCRDSFRHRGNGVIRRSCCSNHRQQPLVFPKGRAGPQLGGVKRRRTSGSSPPPSVEETHEVSDSDSGSDSES